jgi:hypothetical protein
MARGSASHGALVRGTRSAGELRRLPAGGPVRDAARLPGRGRRSGADEHDEQRDRDGQCHVRGDRVRAAAALRNALGAPHAKATELYELEPTGSGTRLRLDRDIDYDGLGKVGLVIGSILRPSAGIGFRRWARNDARDSLVVLKRLIEEG